MTSKCLSIYLHPLSSITRHNEASERTATPFARSTAPCGLRSLTSRPRFTSRSLRVSFDSVDVMQVVDGRITAHWGVGDLLGLMIQIGVVSGT